MFVIVFRPGPLGEGPFQADINSYGHAPLLFLSIEGATGRAFWAESFVNAHVFSNYGDVEHQLKDRENLAIIALEKMYLAFQGNISRPKIEGVVAAMPLAFGKAVMAEYMEAE